MRYEHLNLVALRTSPEEVYQFIWNNAATLKIDVRLTTRVERVLASTRVGPDGLVVNEIIADYTQTLRTTAGALPPGIAGAGRRGSRHASSSCGAAACWCSTSSAGSGCTSASRSWTSTGRPAGSRTWPSTHRDGFAGIRRPDGQRRATVRPVAPWPERSALMAPRPSHVRLRAYRVGFGDCLLLTVRYAPALPDGTPERHMLIDCGTRAASDGGPSLADIAGKVAEHCGGRLDAVVATHRHQDHIRAFGDSKPRGILDAAATQAGDPPVDGRSGGQDR